MNQCPSSHTHFGSCNLDARSKAERESLHVRNPIHTSGVSEYKLQSSCRSEV